jgi:hypothetical protein
MSSRGVRCVVCLLSVLIGLSSAFAEGPASNTPKPATTVSFYTGSWSFPTLGTGWEGDSIDGQLIFDTSTLQFWFDFSGPISDYQERSQCPLNTCIKYYTGQISSGSVSFSGHDNSGQNPPYSFTGQILPGGTFFGETFCDDLTCENEQDTITFSFEGTGSDLGWWSTGQLQLMGGCLDGGCGGLANFTLQTYAPGGTLVRTFFVPAIKFQDVAAAQSAAVPKDIADLVFLSGLLPSE